MAGNDMARVLVVEDNPVDLDLLTYLLESGGHTVVQARGGREGIEAAAKTMPDLILCDLHMPDVSGYDVVAHLHALRDVGEIPAIAVTVLSSAGDRRRVREAGFRGHIAKPIEPADFLAEIASFLSPSRH